MTEHREQTETKWRGWQSKHIKLDLTNLAESICEPPFNSQFIAENVRPLREAYAAIFAEKLTSRPINIGGFITSRHDPATRGRVGIVVTSGHEGIFLKSMAGVLRRLNPEVADVVVFCPRATSDRMRTDLQSQNIQIISFSPRFDRVAETIRDSRCDVLLYWEICTDATNYFLPYLRLAPVQCTSWGVQVTSGIPNVDYYLSSKLVEPPNAAEHYSERLLLADTLLTYQSPVTAPSQPKTRESFGFSTNQHLYVCAQQLGKFHPDFDLLLGEILANDLQGLVIVTQDRSGLSAKILRQRWAAMPAVADRIVFLPRLDSSDYLSLIMAADVLLDPSAFWWREFHLRWFIARQSHRHASFRIPAWSIYIWLLSTDANARLRSNVDQVTMCDWRYVLERIVTFVIKWKQKSSPPVPRFLKMMRRCANMNGYLVIYYVKPAGN